MDNETYISILGLGRYQGVIYKVQILVRLFRSISALLALAFHTEYQAYPQKPISDSSAPDKKG